MPKLFSYGTLQLEQVQLDTFGRLLSGHADAVIGFQLDYIEITDPAVLASSSQTHHPILRTSLNSANEVEGTVFEITEQELASADSYEVDDYVRIQALTKSGQTCWVYVEKQIF